MPARPPPRPLGEGTQLNGYTLVRRLGTGAMGEVYEAVHAVIGRRVAIKVLRRGVDAALNASKRLLEEARVVNAIRHPGIVDVFDVGVYDGRLPYLVMELLEGRSLTDRVKAEGPLPLPDVLHLLEGVLEPLGAAHRAGVIHRDLKPSNVFLVGEPPGRVKLLDFGIARREGREGDPLTAPSMALGSVGFMAPEQLMGQAVPASDLYAVGCLGFLLATARPVFPLKNIPEAARMHLSQPPPKVRALRADAPELFEAWVDMLLAKDVAARPRTAEAALNALRAVRQDLEAHEKKTESGLLAMTPAPTATHKRTEVVAALQPVPSKAAGPVPKGPPPERPTTVEPDTADEAHRATDSDTTLLDS
jgi:serine/threonine protein kinase